MSRFEKPIECPICMKEESSCILISNPICQHWICTSCINTISINNHFKCPFCREKLETQPILEQANLNIQNEIKQLNKNFKKLIKKSKPLLGSFYLKKLKHLL